MVYRDRIGVAYQGVIQQQLRLFRMDTMDVDCHPCASKQEQIVKLACREQGLGRAVERSKRSSW